MGDDVVNSGSGVGSASGEGASSEGAVVSRVVWLGEGGGPWEPWLVVGAVVMFVGSLFSWVRGDGVFGSFPQATGGAVVVAGVDLMVMVVALCLLGRRWSLGVTWGLLFGAAGGVSVWIALFAKWSNSTDPMLDLAANVYSLGTMGAGPGFVVAGLVIVAVRLLAPDARAVRRVALEASVGPAVSGALVVVVSCGLLLWDGSTVGVRG